MMASTIRSGNEQHEWQVMPSSFRPVQIAELTDGASVAGIIGSADGIPTTANLMNGAAPINLPNLAVLKISRDRLFQLTYYDGHINSEWDISGISHLSHFGQNNNKAGVNSSIHSSATVWKIHSQRGKQCTAKPCEPWGQILEAVRTLGPGSRHIGVYTVSVCTTCTPRGQTSGKTTGYWSVGRSSKFICQ